MTRELLQELVLYIHMFVTTVHVNFDFRINSARKT